MRATAAILWERDAPLSVESIEVGPPGPGEALVRIIAAGMCHTDLAMRDPFRTTPLPIVLGHEGAGIVEAVGPGVGSVAEGDPVVLSFASCGECGRCAGGHPNYCDTMPARNFGGCRLDGTTTYRSATGQPIGSHFFGQSSWSTHAVVAASSLVPVAPDVPLQLAGPFGCGLQTGAGAVLNTFAAPPGSTIAVFGCGAVGLAAVMAAASSGCSTIVGIDPHPARRDLARELGASHALAAGSDNAAELIELSAGRGLDFTFDACGAPGVLGAAVEALAVRGVAGVVAAAGPDVTVELSPRHLLFGRQVRGIIEGDAVPKVFIPRLLELWRQGRFPFERLVESFPLARIADAEAASHDGRVIKPVLVMP